MSRSEIARGLQERAARAAPADQVEDLDGWWLRHSPNCPWWVGTVLPHGLVVPAELADRVVKAEEFYARHGAVSRFQISPPACPEGLDAVLAECGYRRHGLVSLQVASTARVLELGPKGSLRVRLEDHPTPAWFEAWQAAHGNDDDDSRGEWDMLGRVERPCGYASAMIGDDVVAVGRAVADTGWAGVIGMRTLPWAREKGAARSVLAALADWARTQEADRMYLQVLLANTPALRLYEMSGFSELCGYHYRSAG